VAAPTTKARNTWRPRLKRTIEAIESPDGDLILMRTSATDIRIEAPDTADRELLAALDGSHPIAELEGRFGAEYVRTTLEEMRLLELIDDGADEERLDPGVRERFDRQLRYFADVRSAEGPVPSRCQERLAAARVAILGVGGLGGRAAMELACIGVGELWIADGDRVERSNLNRQIQFTEADVGRVKVEAMAARLRAFNSATKVVARPERLDSEARVREFVADADLVLDAADWPTHEIERWCNSACFDAGVPYMTMSHFPPVARVGPLYVPGETGCFACQEKAYRREYPLYDAAIEQRSAREVPAATLGPACGLIGGLVAVEAMHFLTGLMPPNTLGVGHVVDLRTLETKRYEVVADPSCPVCAGPRVEPRTIRPAREECLSP
jgi:molybdopterin-synthase adenylyltransferase